MLGYTIILATSLLGYFAAPMWVPVFSAAALTIISLREHRAVRIQLAAASLGSDLRTATATSIVHALTAGTAAYLLGMVVRVAFHGL